MLKLAVLTGGIFGERGISLNSARSVCDHLEGLDVDPTYYYISPDQSWYRIPRSSLYSNTPSDFDFKIHQVAHQLSEEEFVVELLKSDLTFPVMHGKFAEDGELQKFLETHDISFVGSDSRSCQQYFDKSLASHELQNLGYWDSPTLLIEEEDFKIQENECRQIFEQFFQNNDLSKVVVKPCRSGSSLGVSICNTVEEALDASLKIFSEKLDTRIVIEPFLEGMEFTSLVLQTADGKAVSLLPTEIEIKSSENQIYDYRGKYLPTDTTALHTPPRCSMEVIQRIRSAAEEIFTHFGMRDFARLDGLVLSSGDVRFFDINPISGMEQNSLLFLQGSTVGLSHRDVLLQILRSACKRYGFPEPQKKKEAEKQKTPVSVLFGGVTAERQVSIMSGTNVWMKLFHSEQYVPVPYFMDQSQTIWKLPYAFALHHTSEEIEYICKHSENIEKRIGDSRKQCIAQLDLHETDLLEKSHRPVQMTLDEFVEQSGFVFIALHGGIGESGDLQQRFDQAGILYTGSGESASRICIDKSKTAEVVEALSVSGVTSAQKRVLSTEDLLESNETALVGYWDEVCESLGVDSSSGPLIAKPLDNGCSAGVVKLGNVKDLMTYLKGIQASVSRLNSGVLSLEDRIVEMPGEKPGAILFEEFIETDSLQIKGGDLFWERNNNFVEITVGVLGREGELQAMNPSVSVASGNVLTVEEKFQGGTGINITPPPEEYVDPQIVDRARAHVQQVANAVGVSGFARVDAFMNIKTGDIVVIEINSIPALTPSTVIYHQALLEIPPLYPRDFLERIIEFAIKKI